MNKNNKYYPPLVLVLVLSTVTSIIWVAYSAYLAFYKAVDPVVPEELLSPLNPQLDSKQFEDLKNTIFLNDDQINDTLVVTPFTPLTKSEESSSSAEITEQDQVQSEIVPIEEQVSTESAGQ
jgi:hypothetical protein